MTSDEHPTRLSLRMLTPLLVSLLTALLQPSAPLAAPADTRPNLEQQIKAQYLHHIAKFVQWPVEHPGTPLIICIIGNSPLPFTTALANVSGKMVRNRRIAITYINRIEELGGCDILFVGQSEKGRLDQILAAVAAHPILTVSDLRRFAPCGGMIGFVQDRERVGFEINQRAAQRASLRISAQLLKLASRIVE